MYWIWVNVDVIQLKTESVNVLFIDIEEVRQKRKKK